MSWTQAQLDVCQEAFFILRQDIGLPTPETADSDTSLEWTKCKLAYESARQEVLGAHDWVFGRSAAGRTNIALWPGDVRNCLVYCLARELAIPIAGRIADMQNIDALYCDKLRKAQIRDLEAEVSDDETAREVLASIRAYCAEDSRLPQSIAKFIEKIRAVEDSSLDEILSAHGWRNDVTGGYGVIYNALLEV